MTQVHEKVFSLVHFVQGDALAEVEASSEAGYHCSDADVVVKDAAFVISDVWS